MKKIPEFDSGKCASCRLCVQQCPISCITMSREGKQGKYRNVFPALTGADCLGCGQCAAACPMGCIRMVEAEK